MKKVVCVRCPVGCKIEFELHNGKVGKIKGNRCLKGIEYIKEELKEPKRIVPTSVRVIGGNYPLVSVKTSAPIPKRHISDLMEIVKKLKIRAPVELGDVILKNLFNTGVDLIATRTVQKNDSK